LISKTAWPNDMKLGTSVAAMFVNRLGQNEQSLRGLSIDASYQVSDHLAMQFQRRRFFRNRSIRNKNRLWWPCLLMDWDRMSNVYRDSLAK
jgi:hypothetical protein